MTGLKGSEDQRTQSGAPEAPLSRSPQVWQHLNMRAVLLGLAAVLSFLVAVGLVLQYKPGSTAEPTGEPALDFFAAGPILDFEPGSATLFENERFFLVHLDDGRLLALYDLPPQSQAEVGAGDLEALKCRAVLRADADMAGWLSKSSPPQGFSDRGIWDECSGMAWDVTGMQVWGPESGSLDRFPVEIIDEIIWVDLAARACANPISREAPCISTQ